MWRYFVGMAAGVVIVLGGVLWMRHSATARTLLPGGVSSLAATGEQTDDQVPDPPAASEKTREEKRFSRYDHDRNGAVSRDEFLAARKKAFAKLDLNGDGVLSFDEYAAKTEKRFADADGDKSGALNATEFATTKPPRKAKAASVRCPPASPSHADDDQG